MLAMAWLCCRDRIQSASADLPLLLLLLRFYITDACSCRFAPADLSPQPGIPEYADLISRLQEDDEARFKFLGACLGKLGLEVSPAENPALPTLSDIHLSAVDSSHVSELLCAWADVIDKENNQEYIKGEGDTFCIQSDQQDGLPVRDLLRGLQGAGDHHHTGETGIIDYSTITKHIIAHENAPPTTEMTPRFNHGLYYSSLDRFQRIEEGAETWGNVLMYGHVVTSTNSLLEKFVSSLGQMLLLANDYPALHALHNPY